MIRLSVKEPQISLSAREERPVLNVERAVVVTTGGKPYEGAYEVTPTVEGFTLPTEKKVMEKDLTVRAIPIFSVSNTAGGSTVYIAMMDDEPDGAVAILGKARLGEMIL